MRILIDTLIALMLIALVAGVLYYQNLNTMQEQEYLDVHRALDELHNQMCFHAAVGDVECNDRGYAKTVYTCWFSDGVPANNLTAGGLPWIDFAPPGDYAEHPPDPVIRDTGQAGFWYNPNRGLFRARIPQQESEQESLRVYNYVNQASLQSLPYDMALARKPLPLPAELPSTQHASISTGQVDHLVEQQPIDNNQTQIDDITPQTRITSKPRPTLVTGSQ